MNTVGEIVTNTPNDFALLEFQRLGDRKFKLTVYVGTTAEGKRVYFKQVVHGTKEVADRRLGAILDDIANGRTPTRS